MSSTLCPHLALHSVEAYPRTQFFFFIMNMEVVPITKRICHISLLFCCRDALISPTTAIYYSMQICSLIFLGSFIFLRYLSDVVQGKAGAGGKEMGGVPFFTAAAELANGASIFLQKCFSMNETLCILSVMMFKSILIDVEPLCNGVVPHPQFGRYLHLTLSRLC